MNLSLTRPQQTLLALNILIVVIFGWFYGQALNYEFLAYVVSIGLITGFLFGTLHLTRFSNGILFGVTLWALLHMLGGSVQTADGVLYAWQIYPFFNGGSEFYVLKFDQVVHAYLYGVVAVMFLHLLREVVGIKTHVWLTAFIAIFAAAGFATLNEIIEFAAVVVLPETGVGGYYNTMLDIIFNLLGAVVGVLLFFAMKVKN